MTFKEFKELIERNGEYRLSREDENDEDTVRIYIWDNKEQLVYKMCIIKTWYVLFAHNPNSQFHVRYEEICKRFITTPFENKEL